MYARCTHECLRRFRFDKLLFDPECTAVYFPPSRLEIREFSASSFIASMIS